MNEPLIPPAPRNARARAALAERERELRRLQDAYGRVFHEGAPSAEDKQLVRDDLESFCCVRADMLAVPNSMQLAGLVGRFRVWQRIDGLCFPRRRPPSLGGMAPATVSRDGGGIDGQEQRQAREGQTHGAGVADRTDD